MSKLTGMVHRPQNRAQIYDFFPINKEMTKQFLIFVGCKVVFGMRNRGKKYKTLIFKAICLFLATSSAAQVPERARQARILAEKGDSLRALYRFDDSLDAYEEALDLTDDSLTVALRQEIQDRILMAENGLNMAGFVDIPHVLARSKFSLEDFFLHYPLPDSCWRSVPNQLDSSSDHTFARAMFVKDSDRTIYWSAEDAEGIRNIYTSTLRDTLWSLPSLLNEHMTSASDEIYPVPSPDGKSLFFSSAGLYGVGGYDIYVSRWNDDSNDWDEPVNMGFPYSSPADDFLYVDSEDGRYSVFASNRDCSSDSVWVYVLEYDNVPVRRTVENPQELMEISQLRPSGASAGDSVVVVNSAEIQAYMTKLKEVKVLRDSTAYYAAIAAEGGEVSSWMSFRDLLSKAQGQLQQMEMDMLVKGVDLDPDKLTEDVPVCGGAAAERYAFVKQNMGGPLSLSVEVPKVLFDYSFKVLDEAQFAEDQSIPSGLVYQIQIYASTYRATKKSLKGLSPVYEISGANGQYVYRVGLFRTYADVLANLNTVKKVGFRSAFIVAFQDGKSLTVAKAREKEKAKVAEQKFYEVIVTPSGGALDSSVASGIMQQAPGKDIAKNIASDGTVSYVVSPFADKAKADELVLFLKAMGVNDVKSNVMRK